MNNNPSYDKITNSVLTVAVLIMCVILVVMWLNRHDGGADNITTYEQCVEAGGTIAESYPEQCFIHDSSYVNPEQEIHEPFNDEPTQNDIDSAELYIGLTETEAQAKARDEGKVARVVRIDGEDQMMTMDFSPGRLNLSIVDGLVDSVVVEGAEQ